MSDNDHGSIVNINDAQRYADEAPTGMSRFQIERFVIGSEAPSGRYHACCREIAARTNTIRSIKAKSSTPREKDFVDSTIKEAMREIKILMDVAETWKPLTHGKSYEELQEKIWDETFSFKLCIAAASGTIGADCVRNIMLMPEKSICRKLLNLIMSQDGSEGSQEIVKNVILQFNSSEPVVIEIGFDDA